MTKRKNRSSVFLPGSFNERTIDQTPHYHRDYEKFCNASLGSNVTALLILKAIKPLHVVIALWFEE